MMNSVSAWKSILFLLLVASLALPMCAATGSIPAQYCNPAVVSYLVRDETGKLLSETELRTLAEQLPKKIGDASTFVGEVAFAEDGKTFYWPESVDWQKGKKQPSLQFINAGTCVMQLSEVTLTYHGKRMRLLFNIGITRDQHDRRPTVDALPFQEGTFALDLSTWSQDREKLIPANRWKKVAGRK